MLQDRLRQLMRLGFAVSRSIAFGLHERTSQSIRCGRAVRYVIALGLRDKLRGISLSSGIHERSLCGSIFYMCVNSIVEAFFKCAQLISVRVYI